MPIARIHFFFSTFCLQEREADEGTGESSSTDDNGAGAGGARQRRGDEVGDTVMVKVKVKMTTAREGTIDGG